MTCVNSGEQETHLMAFWEAFCSANDFNCTSADELLYDLQKDSKENQRASEDQLEAINHFIKLWDSVVYGSAI